MRQREEPHRVDTKNHEGGASSTTGYLRCVVVPVQALFRLNPGKVVHLSSYRGMGKGASNPTMTLCKWCHRLICFVVMLLAVPRTDESAISRGVYSTGTVKAGRDGGTVGREL